MSDAAIQESARLTDGDFSLGETEMDDLNRKIQILTEHLGEEIELEVTYFLPDERKKGGSYQHYKDTLRRIGDYEGVLIFNDGKHITLQSIAELASELFEE